MLRDKQGRAFQESKTFVIASKPPTVKVKLAKYQARRGETVEMQVGASETTRTIVARMTGAPPVYIRWNPDKGTNTGVLAVPAALAAGKYKLTVTAEDFAHNIGSREVELEVLP
jgi:Ca-activated chloride channel family protein